MDHDQALDDDNTDANSAAMQAVFDRAIARFNDVVPPQIEMRAQSLAARRFVSIPGAQWEGNFGDQWGDTIKLEIPKVKRGVQKIERDYRSNRLAVNFRAASGDASAETAETLDGIYRADGYHFKAQQARDNAFSEGLKGGFGAYRLTNEWSDPYDKDSDQQRINPAMIIVDADQSVFFDGNSKLYDKSDAKFAWVLTALTSQAFRAEYGDDRAISFDNGQWNELFDWYQPEIIRIAEYYEVEDKDEKLYVFTQTLTGDQERWFESQIDAKGIAEKKAFGWGSRTRTVKRRRVRKYIMSGSEILQDCGYIAGGCIPIVPVYGNREYVDNMERFTGYVQDRMDSQRNYNARVSKLAETDALAPREIPIFLAEQMPPAIAEFWQRQNIDRHPYAVVNPVIDGDGKYVAMGPIGKVEPPQLPPVTAALLQIANSDLSEDDQDGADEVKSNTSAEAMDLAATRIDAKSGIYIDNMRQSVQREGEIYLSMAADVYYEPGREVDTLTDDGEDGTATLVEPQMDKAGVYAIHNDFARGKYKVISDVTEATSTRRDKTVRAALNVATVAASANDQEMSALALTVAVMNMDGEGTDVFHKFSRRRLVAQGLIEPNDEEKQEMQAAAQNKQPDPTQALAVAQVEALGAQGQKDQSAAQLNTAKVAQVQADSILKIAQAHAVGGPESAPSGLQPPPDPAKQIDQVASAKLKSAQADKITHSIGLDHLQAHHGIVMDHAEHGLAVRQQDHAESQPVKTAA